MNIAIDIRSLMEANKSGVAEYTYNLIDNLLKIDSENQYFLFYNSFSDITSNLPKWNQPNVHFCGFKYPNKLFNLSLKLFNYPKLDKLIAKRLPQAVDRSPSTVDLFIFPNLNFISLSRNCQRIITVHDLSFELYPQFYSWKGRFWHKIINPKKIISSADKIIAVSENTKNDLINIYKIPAEKISIVYSGIDQKFQPIAKEEKLNHIREKYNLSENFILYLGNLEPRKNIEGLIEAFNILKSQQIPNTRYQILDTNYQLILTGFPAWSYQSIYERAEESKFRDDIKFIGYVDPKDKLYLYNLAKLFVYPSFYEGFGFPPLEAMASGTPVIASHSSSLGEIVGQAGLLVDPHNTANIAEAMRQVLTDEKLRDNLIAKGLEQSQKFNWKNTAEQILNLIKKA
jgi:glycosyltransferase involved in cell wall biosynthesis